jgi:hypothetical protein
VNRGDVCLVSLDPVLGSGIQKTGLLTPGMKLRAFPRRGCGRSDRRSRMTKPRRNIGKEILVGIRQLKRGGVGRVITLPPVAEIRASRVFLKASSHAFWESRSVHSRNGNRVAGFPLVRRGPCCRSRIATPGSSWSLLPGLWLQQPTAFVTPLAGALRWLGDAHGETVVTIPGGRPTWRRHRRTPVCWACGLAKPSWPGPERGRPLSSRSP